MDVSWGRRWHALTAVVAVAAVVTQLGLVVDGASVLVVEDPPGLAERVYRFFAYFTIQSNILVAIACVTLVRDPVRDGRGWRILRCAGLAGIIVTGIVHFFLLRPLLDLDGLNYVCDKLLHMVVPLLAVVGWLAFGPRPRVSRSEVGWSLLWPVAWLAWTLVVGAVGGWFPYPFLDYREEGWGSVAGAGVGITVLFLLVFRLLALADRRLAPTPGTGQPRVRA